MPTKTAKKTATSSTKFTAAERAAMKERAKELKAQQSAADDLAALQEKIAEMPDADRALAEAFHDLVTKNAPDLAPRTWYGMPAYAKDGKLVCFFKPADKFKARYATVGFSDQARLDDGTLWPTEFALTEMTPAARKQLTALVTKAVG